jgi:hypothetical protein
VAEQLRRVAELLLRPADPDDRREPSLVIMRTDRKGAGIRTPVEHRALIGPDPIASIIGIRARPSWEVVGVVASATAQRSERQCAPTPCGFVHLVHRSGVSITAVELPSAETILLGPDTTMREGRIPDACRRIFALDTTPPPSDMTAFVLDAWLSLVLRSALLRPGLRWTEIIGLGFVHHLIGISSPSAGTTPAQLAALTRTAASELDWHRYRSACLALGGCPASELDAEAIDWMDTGMFARWCHDALPATAELLDLLEPVLDATTFDRLWATVSLCRPDGIDDGDR